MSAQRFAAALRGRERLVGYWSVLDAPAAAERIARLGYDYLCLDAQHGLIDYSGLLASLTAVDAGGGTGNRGNEGTGNTVGLVRVEACDATPIGRALDAGAAGVIVPLVNSAADAATAVRAARYPPAGRRSYGPVRADLRIGPVPADADEAVVVLAMIETAEGLAEVDAICATPGLDGVYVGPADLCLGVGGAFPGDPAAADVLGAALVRVREAAARAGVPAGIHTSDGATAARLLAEGYTFASVGSDLTHLEQAALGHLTAARAAS